MDTIPHDHSGSDATQEVANRGMVRPPLVYGAAIVTGVEGVSQVWMLCEMNYLNSWRFHT